MALPPKFAGQKLQFAHPPASDSAVAHTTHTLEFYLDYCCPFSAKIFRTLQNDVIPAIKANPAWASSLTFIFRQQIQPWHPSSTLMHEAALAVLRLAPEKFWEFSAVLFDEQQDYFDVNVVNEKRNDTYRRLAKVAAKVGVDADKVFELLVISDKPGEDGALNAGNKVTNDVKVITKMNRLIGVHVTPTAVFDGVVQDVSSGWTKEQWIEWLQKNVATANSINLSRPPNNTSPILSPSPKLSSLTTKVFTSSKLPEKLIIYHAGTGRITFMAMLKITTLFLGAFFCCVVAPSYIKAEKPELLTAGVVLCGIIPVIFVTYITSPFVTHIHIHLPPYARTSRPILERFIKNLPPTTPLTLTTMSAISKPRYSSMHAGDLSPVRRRLGLINYVRDTKEENAKRKWYMFRAVGKFYVQDKRPQTRVRYQKKTDKVDGWIWDVIKERIDNRALKAASPYKGNVSI
ncbi:thioredoxin-like protein [Fusarium oxysporum]|nr:thioredoxin-like protein [Fusarium oxysporum]